MTPACIDQVNIFILHITGQIIVTESRNLSNFALLIIVFVPFIRIQSGGPPGLFRIIVRIFPSPIPKYLAASSTDMRYFSELGITVFPICLALLSECMSIFLIAFF